MGRPWVNTYKLTVPGIPGHVYCYTRTYEQAVEEEYPGAEITDISGMYLPRERTFKVVTRLGYEITVRVQALNAVGVV